MKIDSPNATGIIGGFGIPTGGTSGQILQKVNNTNYNTQWVDKDANTGLIWNGRIYGSPANMSGASIGGTTTYRTANADIRLTQENVGGQTGWMTFHLPNFDFSKDFRVKANYFILNPTDPATLGDGILIGLGVSNVASIDFPFSFANNSGFKVGIRSYFGGGAGGAFIVENQALTLGANTNSTEYSGAWRTFEAEVRTNGATGQRTIYISSSNNVSPYSSYPLLGKVTTFVPTGKYVTVSSATGAATGGHYINNLIVEYI